MLRFSLIEIAVKLIPARAALHIIFLVVVSVFEITKVILALLSPKRVFFFLLLAIDEVVHLGTPTLPKLHIPHCKILRIYLRSFLGALLSFVAVFVVRIRIPLITVVLSATRSFV